MKMYMKCNENILKFDLNVLRKVNVNAMKYYILVHFGVHLRYIFTYLKNAKCNENVMKNVHEM